VPEPPEPEKAKVDSCFSTESLSQTGQLTESPQARTYFSKAAWQLSHTYS
jgi:hypothetical protein